MSPWKPYLSTILVCACVHLGMGCSRDDVQQGEPLRTIDPRARSLLLEGEEAYQRGGYEWALILADSAARFQPDLAEIYFFRGTVFMALHRFDAALHSFQEAIDRDAFLEGAWMRMGDIESELGRPGEAIQFYRREEALHPHSGLYEKMGRIYAQAGMADSARLAYENAIALDSANAPVHLLYGQLWEQLGDYAAALVHSRKALALRPDVPNYQFIVGSQLFRSGNIEEAQLYLQRAADALPLHYPAQYNLGQALIRLGREGEANFYLARADSARLLMNSITRLERSVALNPSQFGNWIHLGDLYHKAERYEQAAEAFRMAAALEPRNTDVRIRLAKVMMATGNAVEAIKLFQSVLGVDDTVVDVWLNLGLAYAVLGICEEARYAWETAIGLKPDSDPAKDYLSGLCQYTTQ